MDRKKSILNISIFCVLTVALTALVTYGLATLTERKTSIRKYNDFLTSDDKEYDVFFLGTSHVINGIFPMELWKDYKITSYNFGNDASTIPTSYWVLMNALDYATPKLVVVDCYQISNKTKTATISFDYIHSAFDAFPLSKTKIAAAFDLTNDSYLENLINDGKLPQESQGTAFQLLFNYSVYHSRWNDLKWYDFDVNYTPEKGAESRIAVAKTNKALKPDDKLFKDDTIAFEYLDKIVNECKKRDIDVMFTYLPYPADSNTYKEINTINKYANEKGIDFVDFISLDLVNYNTDFYDSVSHLNPSGARKVTDYLGMYISENYLAGHNENLEWDRHYEDYMKYKISNLKEQSDVGNYLMLLNDKQFDIKIELEDTKIIDKYPYLEIIDNISTFNGAGGGKVFFEKVNSLKQYDNNLGSPDFRISVFNKNTNEKVDAVLVYGNNVVH